MNRAIAALLVFTLGMAGAGLAPRMAAAQESAERLVVVELFTSQGCAACPPADALMGELAQREDVIGLSLHVDYWDYIGWPDTFAQAAFTERQQGYSHSAGTRMVYTPQMIVGGQDHVAGVRAMSLADLIQAHQAAPARVTLRVLRAGDGFDIEAEARMAPPRPEMVVQLVSYRPHAQVEIARGERAGTVADHYNVVTTWQIVATWDGAAPFRARLAPAEDAPHVVIVQERDFGPILAAARLE